MKQNSSDVLELTSDELVTENTPHYIGHRSRAKQRFLNAKKGSFTDYDLLEILLFYVVPRVDTKPLARELLNKFGSIAGVLNASNEELVLISGLKSSAYTFFKLINEVAGKLHIEDIKKSTILESWSSLIKYARTTMGHLKTEVFRVIYLDSKYMVIADELQDVGTINSTPFYPREVIKKALTYEASALVLLHNHPSGNVNPSKQDVSATNEIQKIAAGLNINIIDHIIISSSAYYSFQANGLL